MEDRDMATVLSELPTHGADDYVARVIEVYRGAMEVYGPSEERYRAAVEAQSPSVGSSASTNW